MKKLIFAALAAATLMGTTAQAYDSSDGLIHHSEYREQWDISFRHAAKFTKGGGWKNNIIDNSVHSSYHNKMLRNDLNDIIGDYFALLNVRFGISWKDSTAQVETVVNAALHEAANGRSWAHVEDVLENIQEYEASILPEGQTFESYNAHGHTDLWSNGLVIHNQ